MIFNKRDINVIRENYHARDHNNDYDKGNLGFGLIHYAMIRNLRPDNILVVGSQKGYIPAICAMACRDEKKGKVDFVDAGLDMNEPKDNKVLGEKSWGGIGIWKSATKDYWKPLKVEIYINIYVLTTEEFKSKYPDKKYGYIYIDGDHSLEGVSRDFNLFYDSLTRGGIMAFHDVITEKDTDWGKCGVKEFWDGLGKEYNKITLPFEAGLGLLQRI